MEKIIYIAYIINNKNIIFFEEKSNIIKNKNKIPLYLAANKAFSKFWIKFQLIKLYELIIIYMMKKNIKYKKTHFHKLYPWKMNMDI